MYFQNCYFLSSFFAMNIARVEMLTVDGRENCSKFSTLAIHEPKTRLQFVNELFQRHVFSLKKKKTCAKTKPWV